MYEIVITVNKGIDTELLAQIWHNSWNEVNFEDVSVGRVIVTGEDGLSSDQMKALDNLNGVISYEENELTEDED